MTQCHHDGDGLAVHWDRLEHGWRSVVQGSGWRADRKDYGVRGYVRITEVVHHPVTGWNVHLHALMLLDAELGARDLAGLKASLTRRFLRGIRRSGGNAQAGGQDLQPMRPGTEKQLANYCLKGTKPRWKRDGSRSPMAILWDLMSTGLGMALWREFTSAVTVPRRMQIITSKAIDSLCRVSSHYSLIFGN